MRAGIRTRLPLAALIAVLCFCAAPADASTKQKADDLKDRAYGLARVGGMGTARPDRGKLDLARMDAEEAQRIYHSQGLRQREEEMILLVADLDLDIGGLLRFSEAVRNYDRLIREQSLKKTADPEKLIRLHRSLGKAKLGLGQWREAEAVLRQTLDMNPATKDWSLFFDLAFCLYSTERHREALGLLDKALGLMPRPGEPRDQARAHLLASDIYRRLGDTERENARQSLEAAVAAFAQANDESARCEASVGLGYLLIDAGEYRRAKDHFEASIKEAGKLPANARAEVRAKCLLGLGNVYVRLRQFADAEKSYADARAQFRNSYQPDEVKDAICLGNLGQMHLFRGDKARSDFQIAENYFRQALPKFVGNSDKVEALLSLGLALLEMGRPGEARCQFEAAKKLVPRTGTHRQEGPLFNAMGRAHEAEGGVLAKPCYVEALIRHIESPVGLAPRANTLTNLMRVYGSGGNPRAGIFFGKLAISAYQDARGRLGVLDPDVLRDYYSSHEASYRLLAHSLIAEGRLQEALRAIELLKDEEYLFARKDAATNSPGDPGRAWLTETEAKCKADYDAATEELAKAGRAGTPSEDARRRFMKTLYALEKELIAAPDPGLPVGTSRGVDEISRVLRGLDRQTVALYTLVNPATLDVLLVTSNGCEGKHIEVVSESQLEEEVREFREALRDVNNPKRVVTAGRALYDRLIGPLRSKLDERKTRTILWCPDGVLRYIPLAALHKGDGYLVQSYEVAVFAPCGSERLRRQGTSGWRALGLGVSRSVGGLEPLPSVGSELDCVVKAKAAPANAKPWMAPIMDGAFTWQAFLDGLKARPQVVHIASHFRFLADEPMDSFLMLGDGTKLTLGDLRTMDGVFDGVDLLTLSACETAVSSTIKGREFDSFAKLAERQGARAVLASLWGVSEESTAGLMRFFYTYAQKESGDLLGKPRALAMAQREIMRLATASSAAVVAKKPARGIEIPEPSPATGKPQTAISRRFAHPYYWAPFVLTGNWQ